MVSGPGAACDAGQACGICLMIESSEGCPTVPGGLFTLPRCGVPPPVPCGETCNYASDGDCDDGGPGAEFSACQRGSDCTDCGYRFPQPPVECDNTCGTSASNGLCQDGGAGSEYSTCMYGTDCDDCGPRTEEQLPHGGLQDHDHCEGNGECGTDGNLNNCGAYDIYRMVYFLNPSPPPSPPPSPSPIAPPPMGCTDPTAVNYLNFAVVDDGSCQTPGCMDSRYSAYNAAATYNDGSCGATFAGCTNTAAINYRSDANIDDGTCELVGCMDPTAYNFDAAANVAGACTPIVVGCMDNLAPNYYADANTDSQSCTYPGCTDSTRGNFNPSATVDSGLCTPLFPGCMLPSANNYNAAYTVEDGSCSCFPSACSVGRRLEDAPAAADQTAAAHSDVHSERRRLAPGCLDPSAATYAPSATSHDASMCTYGVLGCTDPTALNYFAQATVERSPSDCIPLVYGCTLAAGTTNYNPAATVLDNSCVYTYIGCTDPSATTYNAAANLMDTSLCEYAVSGCNSASATNLTRRPPSTTAHAPSPSQAA